MKHSPRAISGFLLVLLAGCVSSPFERHLAAGRWDEARRVFEADSVLQQQPRAMYNMGLVYASPGEDTWRPDDARELFARVYELQPTSVDGLAARRFMLLLDEMTRSRHQLEAEQVRLTQERNTLAARVDRLRTERDAALDRAAVLERQDSIISADLARMESALRLRDAELASLRNELERLKAIDLRPAQRPVGGNGGGNRP